MFEIISVIIADDVKILREGLKAVLSQEDSIKVVAEASNGKEAYELSVRFKPMSSLWICVCPIMTADSAQEKSNRN